MATRAKKTAPVNAEALSKEHKARIERGISQLRQLTASGVLSDPVMFEWIAKAAAKELLHRSAS